MPPRKRKDQEKTPKALLREKLFVPCEYVTDKHLKAWTAFVPDPDKPDTEDKIELQLYKDLGRVYAFCSGDLAKVRKHFSPPHFKLIDKRVSPAMDHPITMMSELYTPETDPQGAERNQQEVSDNWIKHGYGQIMAPARFGKTITITDIVCRLGLKTLILSHQWDILDQFEKTIREHTDVEAIEKMAGKKLVARLDKWDWERLGELDIVLSSWQAWWHPSKRHYLKQYRDQFGIILVDESHLSSPPCYSKVVNAFAAMYKQGNTATPFKLSELHVVIENILGPVVTKGHSEQMKCVVNYVHTDIEVEKFPRNGWATMIKRLVTNEARNQLIVDEAVSDANDGRHILITTDRVVHAKELAEEINAEGIAAISVTGDTTARDKLWDKARSGEVQVVVAMRRITRLGIDVPLWDTFYNVLPTSDPYNYYQELSRIRTRYEGKPMPLIKDFIDDPDPEVRAAIIGTMVKRNQVYLEQGFEVKNAAFKPRKQKRLAWGRRTRKVEEE
jgi:superfamily II DNA or RNA helicase